MQIKQNENQKILIHDIKKHLNTIAALNTNGENQQIADYLKDLSLSSGLSESVQVCDNRILNAILNRYKSLCQKETIDFRCDIRSKTVDFLSDYEITALFSNLLDNAMTAAKSVPDSFIDVTVKRPPDRPFVILTVVNSCAADPFTPKGKLPSTKPNPQEHGYGLKSVQRILTAHCGESHYYYKTEDRTFHAILLLHLPS
ncbi:MAG: sensor histidine kinase [Lachnospiraceae bacterium]